MVSMEIISWVSSVEARRNCSMLWVTWGREMDEIEEKNEGQERRVEKE